MKKITAPRRSTTLVILTIIGSCRSAPGTLTMQSPHGRGALATRSCHAGAAAESGLASLPRAYTETGFHYFHFRDFSLAGLRRRTPAPPPFSSMNSTPAASRAPHYRYGEPTKSEETVVKVNC